MESALIHPVVCYAPHCTGRAAQYSSQMDGQMGRRLLGSLDMGDRGRKGSSEGYTTVLCRTGTCTCTIIKDMKCLHTGEMGND